MAFVPVGTHHPRPLKVLGIVLVVIGVLWTLYVGAFWFVLWALAGGEGVAITALDWRFFAPTAAGVALVAIGIGLARRTTLPGAELAGSSRGSKTIVAILVGLAAVVGFEYWLSLPPDEGPYPFADAPAGSLIAYTAPDGIRIVRSNGWDTWRIPGTGSMMGPVWSAVGERLAASGSNQAFSFTADGSSRTKLPSTSMTTPVWSPDGTKLVVVADDNPVIRVVRAADGSVLAKLPLPGNDPAWSPDGTTIAFQSNARGDHLDLYLVRPDGSGLRRLTRSPSDPNRTGASGAAWSPDGRRLAFADDRDGYNDIHVIRRDGSGLRRLTRTDVDESNPTWSPDGRRIAFDRTDYEHDRMSIVVLDLRTGRETEVAHADGEFVLEPAWQPIAAR
ncbi:MAG: TolB family protein [Gaiella sp.]